MKRINIPYGNGIKGSFDYSSGQPGLSYAQQALVVIPAFGSQTHAYFYCNLLAPTSVGNPMMISYKDGIGDIRHTNGLFDGTNNIYSVSRGNIHHQYSWNFTNYFSKITYTKNDVTGLGTDFCNGYFATQSHRVLPNESRGNAYARNVGYKSYELKDHLGNVRATVSDCKIGGPSQTTMVPELLSASNYYAFGMLMPRRSYQPESHRFGFNGQEKDDDINGSGNLNTAMYWEYDTRLGRRMNLDPKPDAQFSRYSCFKDNPIFNVDVKGDTTYKFDHSGLFQGMSDLNRKGIYGSLGSNKTETDSKGNEIQTWKNEKSFSFNDPSSDRRQLNSLKVGDHALQIISDPEVNNLMERSGIKERNFITRIFYAATQSGSSRAAGNGNNMDFGMKYLGGSPGGGMSDLKGGFFLMGNQNFAYNAMDAGNWLWGHSMSIMGFDLTNTRESAQANEKWNDTEGDQNAIRRGFQYEVKLKTIKEFKLKY